MGYRLNRFDKPVLMAVPKPMQTEYDIHHILESCGYLLQAQLLKKYRYSHKHEINGKYMVKDLTAGELI